MPISALPKCVLCKEKHALLRFLVDEESRTSGRFIPKCLQVRVCQELPAGTFTALIIGLFVGHPPMKKRDGAHGITVPATKVVESPALVEYYCEISVWHSGLHTRTTHFNPEKALKPCKYQVLMGPGLPGSFMFRVGPFCFTMSLCHFPNSTGIFHPKTAMMMRGGVPGVSILKNNKG